MKKGIIEMCLLHILFEGDEYGYPLMNRMKQYFSGTDDSTYYSILRRLAAAGYTETYTGAVSGGPERKYYRITDSGKKYLEELETNWRNLEAVVRALGIGGDSK
ncbi:MAG: PadR family transcriptional regulator [Lachnospiraceae bacterium]|nr:PadR family transcriptional regulator [Lachnospiraceae bacterium]